MTFDELSTLLKNQPRRPLCQYLDKAPMVHEGYPGTFNLSLTNYENLIEFGNYSQFDHNLIYSKIGQMFRFEDWRDIYQYGNPDNTHLCLFHMGDIGGLNIYQNGSYSLSMKLATENIFHIKSFLVEQLGLDISRFKISYFPGGLIRDATNSKYDSSEIIPKDPTVDIWYQYGFTPDNLFAEFNRNTLLSLHNSNMVTPWGYRNEIHYEYNGELWDIATIENLFYLPIYDENGHFLSVTNWQHSFGVAAIGLERVQAIVNDYTSVHMNPELQQLDSLIMAFLDRLHVVIPNKDIIRLRETLRVLISIFAENTYRDLSKTRKAKIRKLTNLIQSIITDSHLSQDEFERLLDGFCTLNIKIRNTYIELQKNNSQIMDEIIQRIFGVV